jgi:hypothetical protein
MGFKVGDVVKKIKDEGDSTQLYFDKPYVIKIINGEIGQLINVEGEHKEYGHTTWWIYSECLTHYRDGICNDCKNNCSVEGLKECPFYEGR